MAECGAPTAERRTTRSSTRASPTTVTRSGAGGSASAAGGGSPPTSGSTRCRSWSPSAPGSRSRSTGPSWPGASPRRSAGRPIPEGAVDEMAAEIEEQLRELGARGPERGGRPGRARAAPGPRPGLVPALRLGLQGLRGRRRLRARGRPAPEDDGPEAPPRPGPFLTLGPRSVRAGQGETARRPLTTRGTPVL